MYKFRPCHFVYVSIALVIITLSTLIVITRRNTRETFADKKDTDARIGDQIVTLTDKNFTYKYALELTINNQLLNKHKEQIDVGFSNLKEYASVVLNAPLTLNVDDKNKQISDELALLTVKCERTPKASGRTIERDTPMTTSYALVLNMNIKKMTPSVFENIAIFTDTYSRVLL